MLVVAITIGSNISSLQAQRRLGESSSSLTNVFERLSSGKRINRAADGAAELAIATSLNVDSRVYSVGVRNGNDGLSLLSIADAALANLSDVVVRITELATQSANGVYSNKQRGALDQEAQALADEYLRITKTTEFNGVKLFDGSLGDGVQLQLGYSRVTANIGGAIGTGQFGVGVEVSTGAASISIISGDFNRDGIIDLVTSNTPNDSIVLGIGDGTFQQRTTVANLGDRNILTSDLNNDGILDLVAGGSSTSKVSLGNGDGSFKTPSTIISGTYIYSLTIGDLNGDGSVDLVTADSSNNRISLRLGNGDGSFMARTTVGTGNSPKSVAIGDLNRDGILDIVSAYSNDNTAGIMLGNGDGTFKPATTVSVGDRPHSVVTADLNNDGVLDIVTADQFDSTASILLGNGDGSFQPRTAITTGTQPLQIASSDINGDGNPDLLTADYGSNTASIFIGNGNGTFQSRTTVTTGTRPWSISAADFNRDGVLDIATANSASSTASIFLAQTVQGRGALLDFSLDTKSNSLQALGMLRQTLDSLNSQRGAIGASQSRIAVAISNLQLGRENFAAAESRIRDTDVASDTALLVSSRIIQQSGAAILSQSNQQPALALQLLGL